MNDEQPIFETIPPIEAGSAKKIALPTPPQIEWANAEIGVIIHLDMQVFDPSYNVRKRRGQPPSPSLFEPDRLDTDQWLDVARAAGANYAILVAKHCSGFSLWPTRAHSYHVGNTPWRKGNGDIVANFFASCQTRGLRPGLYCSTGINDYSNVPPPGQSLSGNVEAQKAYNHIVETQLTELWANYGEIFEIWFDGGVLPPQKGGPEILPLMAKYQPNAVVFQGPPEWPHLLRWGGNERGDAPDPCWSATNTLTAEDGTTENNGFNGDPDGTIWAPCEADMPNRDQHKAFLNGWFWRENEDRHLYSLDHLTNCYFTSVGRGVNLLLGMVIDQHGEVPEADSRRFSEFGKQIKSLFSTPISRPKSNDSFHLKIVPGKSMNLLRIQENLTYGERIRDFVVETPSKNGWREIYRGKKIGHKRLIQLQSQNVTEVRLRVLESADEPAISDFQAFSTHISRPKQKIGQ